MPGFADRSSLSRRKFIYGSALASATVTAALPMLAQAPEQVPERGLQQAPTGAPPVRLGLASYTFRNFTRAQLIGFMQQLHVTALNAKDVKDHLPTDAAGEAAALADYKAHGISLHAVGAVYFPSSQEADIRSNFEYARRAGVDIIVAGDPQTEALPLIAKLAAEYRIRIAIHNHGPEDKIYHSPLDVLRAVQNLNEYMGCCIDIGHCVRAGTSVVEAIHACGPRLFNLHAKDLTSFTDKASQVAVGEGIMPMRSIFQALIETRYQGFVDLEYEVHAEDPMPGVISSFAYMRGVLAGLGYPTHAAGEL